MYKNILIVVVVACLFVAGVYLIPKQKTEVVTETKDSSGKIVLQYAIHWTNKDQTDDVYDEKGALVSKGLKHYLAEYTALNPDIVFDIKTIPYGKYADTLKVLSDSDLAPDIYQIYSPWGVSYAKDGILAVPPADIKDDVLKNYISTAGVTINNQIWGIPTEINTYVLLYNKDIFKKAGLVDANGIVLYPKTWNELVDTAVKLSKKDSKGFFIQYGIAFNHEDWQIVDPFLSLLYSNGGKYLSDDMKKSLFNSPEGVAALDAEVALFKKGATSISSNFFDFGKGNVAMVIAPPWTKSGFKTAFGDKFESTVGVAPFPLMKKQTSLGYSWFMGVMEKSKNKDAAWKFLKWFTADIQPSGTTRYGDLLADSIGAIPSRKVDFESHKNILGDFFTKVYVGQIVHAVAEPNVLNASSIKSALMKEILSAFAGNKTSKQALDDAAITVDNILSNN